MTKPHSSESVSQLRRLSPRASRVRTQAPWVIGFMLASLFSSGAWAVSAAVHTTLKDQFEREHLLSAEFGKQPVVIVAGDQRETRNEIRAWATALRKPLVGKARLLGLAELDSVPFFIPNSTVTDKLIEMFPKLPVLCDWGNKVYEAIGFGDDTLIAVAVYDQKGERTLSITGKQTPKKLAEVLRAVAGLTAGSGKK